MDIPFLQQEILWGIEQWRVIAAVVLIALGILSRPLSRFLIRRFVTPRHRSDAPRGWAEDAIIRLPKPLSLVLHVGLWYAAALVLNLPEEPYNVRLFVVDGLLVAVVIAITGVVFGVVDVAEKVASRWAAQTETRLDDQLIPLLQTSLKILLVMVVGIGIVDMFGYSVASLVASLSVGGLALALAAKDTVANLFGSVVLFADQPFNIGDLVDVGGTEGTIEEIGLRVTRIRRIDRSVATVPNQSFTTATVINYSKRPHRRLVTTVGLAYETRPEQIEIFVESMRVMLREMENIDPDTILVHLESLAESSLNVRVQALTSTPDFGVFMATQESVLMSILQHVEDQGLSIAYPTRTLYLQGSTPET